MKTTTVGVKGMTCSGCAASVTRVLQQIEGVKDVAVSLEQASATVTYDPAVADAQRLRTAIDEAGYEAA